MPGPTRAVGHNDLTSDPGTIADVVAQLEGDAIAGRIVDVHENRPDSRRDDDVQIAVVVDVDIGIRAGREEGDETTLCRPVDEPLTRFVVIEDVRLAAPP